MNVDARAKICEAFGKDNWIEARMIRKNQRPGKKNQCSDYSLGVDLNRNYGFKFGFDDTGSSSNPCAQDYRGKHAFSEPETQAMRNFMSWHSLISGIFKKN